MTRRVVRLEDWYEWPVHCPFCGTKSDEYDHCQHLLYVVGEGCFLLASDRMGFGDKDMMSIRATDEKLKVADMFPNHVQFEVVTPIDIGIIGFAAFEDELCGWRHSVDPRTRA